jgi:hypothetical protein
LGRDGGIFKHFGIGIIRFQKPKKNLLFPNFIAIICFS